ncbi:hypothetical protein GCM10010341_87910 [Streptomyces noursei]|nr:hypothetical protein GCM10010341_87910 [Streptomyces noursei]
MLTGVDGRTATAERGGGALLDVFGKEQARMPLLARHPVQHHQAGPGAWSWLSGQGSAPVISISAPWEHSRRLHTCSSPPQDGASKRSRNRPVEARRIT